MNVTFDESQQVFVFCHVPKCGGTTTHNYLEMLTRGRYVHCFPNGDWKERISSAVGAGGHQMNGQSPILQKTQKKVVRLIILREPVERFLSFYKHIQDHPNHYLSKQPGVMAMTPVELAQHCIEKKILEFFDLQSKYVMGPQRPIKSASEVVEVFHAEFDFYATLEHINFAYERLASFFDAEAPPVSIKNISKPRKIPKAEMQRLAELVYEHNYNDLQLYIACNRRMIEALGVK